MSKNIGTDSMDWRGRSKFRPPLPLQIKSIERKSLQKLIDDNDKSLILLTAPAGFGKSTLLSQWCKKNENKKDSKLIWMNLDEGDRTAVQFLDNLILAFKIAGVDHAQAQTVNQEKPTGLAIEVPTGLAIEVPTGLAIEVMMTNVYRLLENAGSCTVIFDDYQQAESPQLNRLINDFILALLPNCRLIISSRHKPQIKISLLRIRGFLHEITEQSLRFGIADIKQLFNEPMDNEQYQLLLQQTDGWPAILQLAKIHNESATNSEPISGFYGKYTEVAEYLAEQVFSEFTGEQQDFFIESSFLDNFCAELVDTVREHNDSVDFLSQLAQMQPLITTYDSQWYRYNQLFKDFLLQILKKDKKKFETLCLRASHWYEQQGDFFNAIRQYCLAGHYDQANELIKNQGGWILGVRCGDGFMANVLKQFPDWYINRHTQLQTLQVYFLIKQGNLKEARFRFDGIRITDTEQATEIRLKLIEVTLNLYEDRLITEVDEKDLWSLVSNFPASENYLRSVGYSLLFMASLYRGKVARAKDVAKEAILFLRQENLHYALIFSHCHLGIGELLQGASDEALSNYRAALAIIEAHFANIDSLTAIFRVLISEVDYLCDRLGKFDSQYFAAVQTVLETDGWFQIYLSAYITATRFRFNKEGYKAAHHYLSNAGQHEPPRLQALIEILKAEILVRTGRTVDVIQQLNQKLRVILGNNWRNETFYWQLTHIATLVEIRRAVYCRDYVRAKKCLAIANGSLQKTDGIALYRQELALWEALVNYYTGNSRQAIEGFNQVMEQIRLQGTIRIILDMDHLAAPMVLESLRRFQNRNPESPHTGFLKKIIVSIREHQKNNYGLTRREYEVLLVLAEGVPNKVIARQLNIAEDTVKFHLKNIYKKIGVDCRKMAIAKAQEQFL